MSPQDVLGKIMKSGNIMVARSWWSPSSYCKAADTSLAPTEFRSCVKVEVAVLYSQSVRVFMVSVDVKQHLKKNS